MKYLIALFVALMSLSAIADTYVKGHTRSDGTYVQPHYRSSPNNYKFDNYSSQGNTNPYNGQKGSSNPYYVPPPSNYNPKPYNFNDPYNNN